MHGSVRSSWVPPNGNLIKDDHAEYSYDGFNRLSEVKTVEGKTQRNRYDAEGLRAELEENGELVRFLYHNGEVIAETGENQATIRYIQGIGLISSDSEEAKFYYHYVSDERGSITDIVKAAVRKKLEEDSQKTQNEESTEEGQETGVLNHYEYDAFGNTLECKEEVENRFRFTGEIYDAVTGQYYLRARFYNPVLGRFIQEDDRYTDGLNLYAYCKNNPVRYTDPSGHETESQPDRDNQEAPGGRTDRPDAPPNEKSNQAEIRKLVEELNAAGGATPDEAQAIRELAEEYNLDYDSLGLKIKEDAATVNSAGSQVGESGRYSHTQNLDGLNEVRRHLTNDVDGLDFEPNKAMMNKIEEMLSANQELTGAYKDFYEHELTESMLMQQGHGYNEAHNMALEIHNVQPQALYSPEIVQEYSKWFNKNDFEYWGITKE